MAIGTTAAILGAAAIGSAGSLASGALGASASKKAAATQAASADKAAALQKDSAIQSRIDAYPWAFQGAQALYQYMDEIGVSRPQNMILPDLNSGPFAQNQASNYVNPNQPAAPQQPVQQNKQLFSGLGGSSSGNGGVRSSGNGAGLTPYNPVQAQPQTVQPAPQPIQPDQNLIASPKNMAMTARKGFQETPGYQYNVEEAEKGVINNLSALGMRNSGAALKALTKTRMGLANQEYGGWLNRLASAAGMGQTQTNQSNALATNAATNIGQTYQDAGAARASGYVGAANAWGNALGGVANNIGGALGSLGSNKYPPKPSGGLY